MDEYSEHYPDWIRGSILIGVFFLGIAFWAGAIELYLYLSH